MRQYRTRLLHVVFLCSVACFLLVTGVPGTAGSEFPDAAAGTPQFLFSKEATDDFAGGSASQHLPWSLAAVRTKQLPPQRLSIPKDAFQIVGVSYPPGIISPPGKGDITVWWQGTPTFPVTMIFRPKEGRPCPADKCFPLMIQTDRKENPLFYKDVVLCSASTVNVSLDFEILLRDADGKETPAKPAPFQCVTATFPQIAGNVVPPHVPSVDEMDTEPVTMYNVWRTGDQRLEAGAKSVRQSFLAEAQYLDEIRLDLGAPGISGEVTLYLVEPVNQYAMREVTVAINNPTSPTVFRFDPPHRVELGKQYEIFVKSSDRYQVATPSAPGGAAIASNQNWLRFRFSRDPEDYVFGSGAFFLAAAPTAVQDLDLNMVIQGRRLRTPPRARPSTKALLILLENGGVRLEQVDALRDIPLPDVTIATCGSFRFGMDPGETLQHLIERRLQELQQNLRCVDPRNWDMHRITFDEWWRPFSDKIAEDVARAIQIVQLGTAPYKYDHVIVLQDFGVHQDVVLDTLRQLAPAYVVDIHVLTHGGTDSISGMGTVELTPANFFLPLKQKMIRGEIPLLLRSVYQMNCKSGSLQREWEALGAQVSNGTDPAKDNYMSSQYFPFVQHWVNNETFRQSTDKSYDEAKPFFQLIYLTKPEFITDSRLFVRGNGDIRITSP